MDEERGAMFTEERQSAIEKCLRENGKVKVKELSEMFQVTEDSQKNLKLLVFSPQIFWEHINELESDEQIPDGATEIDGTLSKYISFWLTEDKIDVTLLFVEDNDGNTHIYAEDNTCNNCNSSVFGKTIGDYIKLYEDMHLNSQVYDDFNVAYLISEASS